MFKSLLLPWKRTKTKVMVPEQTMEDEQIQEQRLVPCNICNRTFLPLALKKHGPICEKNSQKKRKVFDSLKQRVEGTDLAQFHQKSYLKRQESIPKSTEKINIKSPSKWEESHQKLVDAIRTAKGASRDMSSSNNKKHQQPSSTNERCPHCERQFGPKAFDRHVEWCKEHTRTRIQKSPANVLLAKERLEARIKYKVPPLNKSKRSLVKEKYSSNAINRTESVCSVKSTPSLRTNVKKPKSVLDLGTQVEEAAKIDKTNSVMNLEDMKKQSKETNRSDTKSYDPFLSAERQFMELLECDDFKPFENTKNLLLVHTPRPHTVKKKSNTAKVCSKKSVKSAEPTSDNKKRTSVIDPPACFQDPEDEFELLENLINDHFNDDTTFFLDMNKRNKEELNVILNKERKYSDDMSSIDSNLINEHDNLSIPEHFKMMGSYSPTDDTDTTIQNEDVYGRDRFSKRKIENKGQSCKNSKTKNKSGSSSGFVRESRRQENKERTQEHKGSSSRRGEEYFKTESRKSPTKMQTKQEETFDFAVKSEDLFTVDDKMYAEYKIYEEMYLKEKENKSTTKKQKNKNTIKSYGIDIPSEQNVNKSNKVSDDSAYGSLNRNTPKPKTAKLSPLHRKRIDSASSSGSENITSSDISEQRMSKFCHECGNRYPLTTAKFCVECGVKRLVL